MDAFPFDSEITGYDSAGIPQYDRASNAEEFARLIASFLSNGVFGTGMCAVLADSGLSATVSVGNCLINGRYGHLSTAETVTFETANAYNNRIDTVVLRLDLSNDVRNIVTDVLTGTPAQTPVAPTLTRDGTIWELGIADVLIPSNSSQVSQSNITDTRLDATRCSIVSAINSTIDTTALYLQIQNDLEQFQSVEQVQFDSWFETIQNVLSSDAAGNLYLLVSAAQSTATTAQTTADSKATTTTYSATFDSSGWSASVPYTQTASVTGILSTDNPIADIISLSSTVSTASAQLESFGYVGQISTADGSITAYCYDDKPTTSFTVQLKVIR